MKKKVYLEPRLPAGILSLAHIYSILGNTVSETLMQRLAFESVCAPLAGCES